MYCGNSSIRSIWAKLPDVKVGLIKTLMNASLISMCTMCVQPQARLAGRRIRQVVGTIWVEAEETGGIGVDDSQVRNLHLTSYILHLTSETLIEPFV